MGKKKIFWLVLAFLVILGSGSYLRSKGFRAPVPEPTAKPQLATPFPPPDWGRYSSRSFGYSLFYPPEWTPREQGKINDQMLDVTSFTVVSKGKKIPLVQVKVSSIPYQEELANRDIETSGFAPKGKVGEKVVVNGIEGVRVMSQVGGEKKKISVFLPGDKKTFILIGSPEAIPDQDQTKLIDQVVSTFKLL
jgi:hypothetical protein